MPRPYLIQILSSNFPKYVALSTLLAIAACSDPDGTNGPTDTTDGSTDAAEGSTSTTDGSTDTADGSTDATDGSTDTTDGSTDVADGSTDTTDGSTDATDGSTDTTDGSTDAADGSTDAADGSTDTADGSTDATDGSTDTTDGSTDAADGSTDTIDGSTDTVDGSVDTDASVDANDASINAAPLFTSGAAGTVPEGRTATGYTATATDSDGDTLSFWVSGGADHASFSIDETTGVLSFLTAPDFEAPADANADNVYEVELSVSDGRGGQDTLAVGISVTDVTHLSVHVTYPTPNANLGGDVTTSSIAGYLVDDEDGEVLATDVASLSVNGEPALLDAANASRWRVKVPVALLGNTIEVSLSDASGNTSNVSQQLFNSALFNTPAGLTLDAANHRLLVIDRTFKAVLSVDLGTNLVSVVSSATVGDGPALNNPSNLALDATNNRALLIDKNLKALVAIALDTGDRTILSSSTVGSGTAFGTPEFIAFDVANNRVYVTDSATAVRGVWSVELATGNRTIVSNNSTGTGTTFATPAGIALDVENDRLLVADRGSANKLLFSIEPSTGNRTVLSSGTVGAGTELKTPYGVLLDAPNNRVLVSDSGVGAVFAIDLSSGNRTVVASSTVGDGPLDTPYGLCLDETGTGLFFTEQGAWLRGVAKLDLTSGDRVKLANTTGSGPALIRQYTALDSARNRVLIAGENAIMAVDLGSGARTIISDASIGTGPLFGGFADDIVIDAANDRALVLAGTSVISVALASGDRTQLPITFSNAAGIAIDPASGHILATEYNLQSLVSADPETGEVTTISGAGVGAGDTFKGPRDIAIDGAGGRVLVNDDTRVFAVDLASGERSILAFQGSGDTKFGQLTDIALDTMAGNIIVLDRSRGFLFSVDPATGDRTILADVKHGMGSLFSAYSMNFDEANRRLFLLDVGASHTALVIVDVDTGELADVSQ